MVEIGVLSESHGGEKCVALVPDLVAALGKVGATVLIESEAGRYAHFSDLAYLEHKAEVAERQVMLRRASCVVSLRPFDLDGLRPGTVLIGMYSPSRYPEFQQEARSRELICYSLDQIPRTSRAQSMDVLSSLATVAGYKSALIAANLCPRFFPMMMTAAGMVPPAKVLVIGAGVAGLQAIATCRRLGAQVEAYDIRAAAKEEIHSLGAKFLELGASITGEGSGGYARELTEEEKVIQREALATHISTMDIVITTAAVPNKKAPIIIPASTVNRMKNGAVIVDIAAESGGNCELSVPGSAIEHNGVTIAAPTNIPSLLPAHASRLYAGNLVNFLRLFFEGGTFNPLPDDEIAQACRIA